MDERTDERMDEWTDERMDANGWTKCTFKILKIRNG